MAKQFDVAIQLVVDPAFNNKQNLFLVEKQTFNESEEQVFNSLWKSMLLSKEKCLMKMIIHVKRF